MFCARCGGLVGHDELFCARCGLPAHLATAGAPAAAPTPTRGHSAAPYWIIAVVLAVAAGVTAGVLLTRHSSDSTPAAMTGPARPSPSTTTVTAAPSTTASPSTSPTLSLAELYARQQSGVVRIETLGCGDSQGVGTGFLLSPTLVATVDHVVADSAVISLIDGTQHATGQVVGYDETRDLALVRSSEPLSGFVFHFSSVAARVGDQVAAVGFPIADPITLTQGNISGLDRSVDVEGSQREGLLETDAAVNPGNSGGPLMEPDGSVIGLVDALNTEANGIAYAVPASQAAPAMSGWMTSPMPVRASQCANPTGPSNETTSVSAIPGLPADVGSGVAATLNTYFNAINDSDYQTAVSTYSDRLQARVTAEDLAEGDATSIDSDQQVITARMAGDGSARVALSFVSLQDADHSPDHSGDTCDVWTLVYTMTLADDGTWRIDGTKPYNGSSHTSC